MTTHNKIDSGKTVAARDKSRQAALLDEPKRPWYVRAGIGLLVLAVVGAAGGGRAPPRRKGFLTSQKRRLEATLTSLSRPTGRSIPCER